MKKLYMVMYKVPNWKDMRLVIAELQKSPWAHYVDEVWFVLSNETAEQLYSRLAPLFVQSDNLLVGELNARNYYGWMPKDFWDWYNEHSKN